MTPSFTFPENDLLLNLIDLYFTNVNKHIPLFHRPTFDRAVNEGLHWRVPHFAATLLAVCATGSRYSDDPRVLVDGCNTARSSGWKWFRQIQPFRNSFEQAATLYELQTICVRTLGVRQSTSLDSHHDRYQSCICRRHLRKKVVGFYLVWECAMLKISEFIAAHGILGNPWWSQSLGKEYFGS